MTLGAAEGGMISGMLMPVLCLALVLGIFHASPARAQTAPVYTNFLNPVSTPPLGPMSFDTLLDAINGDASAIAQFSEIAADVVQIDPDTGLPRQVCTPGCVDVTSPGGQNLINQIVNALGGAAPAEWLGPPGPGNLPTDVSGPADLIARAIAQDSAALQQIQAAFVDENFFAPLGYLPTYDNNPDPAVENIVPTGQNLGVDALAFIAGGYGLVALETIALALDGNADARDVLSVIFSFRNPGAPPYVPCLPAAQPCPQDFSNNFLTLMDTALSTVPAEIVTQYDIGNTPAEVVRNAIAGNSTAQYIVNQTIAQFLANTSTPGEPGYVGQPGVVFLGNAISGITGSEPAIATPPGAPPSSSKPTAAVPPGAGNATGNPCSASGAEAALSGFFTVDPCQFTRNTRDLAYAQNYMGGEKWSNYFREWTIRQWIPALKRMTAQMNAAIIDQTRQIGSAIDAITASNTAIMIQKREFDTKMAVLPSELACTSASPLASGMAFTEVTSTALRQSLRNDLSKRANTGRSTPLLGP